MIFSLVGRCRCRARPDRVEADYVRGRSRLCPPGVSASAVPTVVPGSGQAGFRVVPPPDAASNKRHGRRFQRSRILSILPVDFAWQNPCHPLHRGAGRAGPVCRRAFVRFMENMVVRTSFLLDILRDRSEGKRGGPQFFHGRQGLPVVSGSPSCPRLQVPGLRFTEPGLIRKACTDGEDRFRAKSPATGSNLENPVRPRPRQGAGLF